METAVFAQSAQIQVLACRLLMHVFSLFLPSFPASKLSVQATRAKHLSKKTNLQSGRSTIKRSRLVKSCKISRVKSLKTLHPPREMLTVFLSKEMMMSLNVFVNCLGVILCNSVTCLLCLGYKYRDVRQLVRLNNSSNSLSSHLSSCFIPTTFSSSFSVFIGKNGARLCQQIHYWQAGWLLKEIPTLTTPASTCRLQV